MTDAEIDVFEAWFGERSTNCLEKAGGITMAANGSGGSLPAGLNGAAGRQRSLDPGSAPPGERLLRIARLGDRGRIRRARRIGDRRSAARVPADDRRGDGETSAFDVIVVHSFSRFFRDPFGLEFYVRKLAKNGVRLVSITQELGDDPSAT